jgi:hypothetical protein
MFRGAGSRLSRPLALAAIAACATAIFAACGGSDSAEKPQTVSGGAPSSSQAGDLVDAAAAKQINNPRAADRCTNQRSNEEICSDYSNYLLSYRPLAGDPDYGTRGPYLVGSQSSPKVESSAEIQDVSTGSGDDGKARPYEKGPVSFGGLLQVDFDDTRDRGNSGSVRIGAQAGDVDFGSVHFWMKNMDGRDDEDDTDGTRNGDNDWAYCEKQRGGGGGPMFLSCGAPNEPSEGIQECDDDGDDEECGFSFYMQDYPVRVGVFNQIADSQLQVESVTEDQPSGTSGYGLLISEQATNLKGKASLNSGDDGLWLAGFRAVPGAQIKVQARIKPTVSKTTTTTEAGKVVTNEVSNTNEGWSNARVFMTATFVKTGDKEVKPVCEVQNKSTGTAGSCQVNLTNGSVSKPGTATFTLQAG